MIFMENPMERRANRFVGHAILKQTKENGEDSEDSFVSTATLKIHTEPSATTNSS
jgi:hypothetical protein